MTTLPAYLDVNMNVPLSGDAKPSDDYELGEEVQCGKCQAIKAWGSGCDAHECPCAAIARATA